MQLNFQYLSKKLFLSFLVILFVFSNLFGQGNYDIVINEFLASNSTDATDNYGEYEDWIEIYNYGNTTIDIGGLYITDDLTDLLLWQIPDNQPDSTSILPGEFLVLWADKDTEQGVLHINLKLSTNGEEIAIVEHTLTNDYIIDSKVFGLQVVDVSYGRFPDGSTNWESFNTTTFGLSNISNLGPPPTIISGIYINEFLTINDSNIVDNYGEHEDWIEFYNASSDTVDLGGLFVTDNLSVLNLWQIPDNQSDSTTILPGEFLLFWADNNIEQGVLHLNFKLSGNGEQIGLIQIINSDINYIDTLSYGIQYSDSSYGRTPDGGASMQYFEEPTPNFSNIIEVIQNVDLPAGWSIFSIYMNPVEASFDSVFSSIVQNVILAKSETGLIYWPLYGINGIGDFSLGRGYQINMTNQATLSVSGDLIIPENTVVSLNFGWNIIGYLRTSPMSIETIFNGITNNVIIVKSGSGSIYWPQYNVNSIGDMHPGQGYQLKTLNAETLIFPAN
jgi:hypothetical protein